MIKISYINESGGECTAMIDEMAKDILINKGVYPKTRWYKTSGAEMTNQFLNRLKKCKILSIELK